MLSLQGVCHNAAHTAALLAFEAAEKRNIPDLSGKVDADGADALSDLGDTLWTGVFDAVQAASGRPRSPADEATYATLVQSKRAYERYANALRHHFQTKDHSASLILDGALGDAYEDPVLGSRFDELLLVWARQYHFECPCCGTAQNTARFECLLRRALTHTLWGPRPPMFARPSVSGAGKRASASVAVAVAARPTNPLPPPSAALRHRPSQRHPRGRPRARNDARHGRAGRGHGAASARPYGERGQRAVPPLRVAAPQVRGRPARGECQWRRPTGL